MVDRLKSNSTSQVARLLDRAECTVREWCRHGRIGAKKKPCGRGKGGEWLVSHDECVWLRNERPLPFGLMTEGRRSSGGGDKCSDEPRVPQHQA